MCVYLLSINSALLQSILYIIHIVHWHDPGITQAPNSFTLAVCLEDILRRKLRIDNRKSLYFNHGTKEDKNRNLKLKISNANTVIGVCTNKGNCLFPYTLENRGQHLVLVFNY